MAVRKVHLQSVGDSDEFVPVMSVSDASASGSRLAELQAMRRVIARRLDDELTPAAAMAALSKRLFDVGREIEDLMREVEGDDLDQAADSPDEDFDPSSV